MRLRAALKHQIRLFFERRSYCEIDSPIVVTAPGTEVHLHYFKTSWQDHVGKMHPLYLRSSPELHMKQAVADGMPKIFQIAPCFRGGGELAEWHHPEFTMLEWYEAGINFEAFITLTEALLRETHDGMQEALRHEKCKPSFTLPKKMWRYTVAEAFKEFADLTLVDSDPDLAKKARSKGIKSVREQDDFETAFFKILIERVEPKLTALGGVVLHDYPPSQAALATVQGGVAKRFEIYLERVELCNGFEELLSLKKNKERIQTANSKRHQAGLETPPEDPDFYAALAKGLPPCCGNALGFDRWLALLIGDKSLDRVIPFRNAHGFRNDTDHPDKQA
jgi:lysyl-tRNA synthetase class 2